MGQRSKDLNTKWKIQSVADTLFVILKRCREDPNSIAKWLTILPSRTYLEMLRDSSAKLLQIFDEHQKKERKL